MDPFISWMLNKKLEHSKTRLALSIDRLVDDYKGDGNQKRYFRAFVDGEDVSAMLGNFIGRPVSKAKDTKNCILVKGCGMDMRFWLQLKTFRTASEAGYPYIFDEAEYEYLGRNQRP